MTRDRADVRELHRPLLGATTYALDGFLAWIALGRLPSRRSVLVHGPPILTTSGTPDGGTRAQVEVCAPAKLKSRPFCLRFAKLIACDNEDIGTYAKLVDDRNVSAHANGNIFLREQGSLEGEYADPIDQIREVLVHENYVSRKDIDICVAYDLSAFAVREHAEAISDPHQPLAEKNVGVTNAADLF